MARSSPSSAAATWTREHSAKCGGLLTLRAPLRNSYVRSLTAMTYAAVRRIVIPVLTAAAIVGNPGRGDAAQRTANPARQGAAASAQQSGTLPSDDDQSAERTRQQLEQLF